MRSAPRAVPARVYSARHIEAGVCWHAAMLRKARQYAYALESCLRRPLQHYSESCYLRAMPRANEARSQRRALIV